MRDENKTKQQLISELNELRERVSEFETPDNGKVDLRPRQVESNDYILNENEEIVDFLKNSRLFTHWPQKLVSKLIPLSRFADFPSGTEILVEGQRNDSVYFIVRGTVSIYAGDQFIIDLKRKGDIFGEMSIISEKVCVASVIAKTPVRVFSIMAKHIGNYTGIDADELNNTLYRLFAMIMTDKLSLTTQKAKDYEKAHEALLTENVKRRKAEAALLEHKVHLEGTIKKRTSELVDEISERKTVEHNIRIALKEKETLLREIHHRVKNNMQIIASLLKLQIKDSKTEETKAVLQENMGRIYAMSAIHENLYRSDMFSQIDFEIYVKRLVKRLTQTYSINPENVRIEVKPTSVKLTIDQANPLGLVINELVTNALKYAFPDNRPGVISIRSKLYENRMLHLTIEDNGIGMPAGIDWNSLETLGLKLVKELAERQLRGELEFKSENGTRYDLRISVN